MIFNFNFFNVCFINDSKGETGPVFTHPYIGSLTIPDGVNVAITDYNKKVFYIDKNYFHLAHRIQTPIPKLLDSLYICLQELRIISFSVVNMTEKSQSFMAFNGSKTTLC